MAGRVIDLNSDLGEGFGAWELGPDEELLGLISSANVACGFHGGDPRVMERTVAACLLAVAALPAVVAAMPDYSPPAGRSAVRSADRGTSGSAVAGRVAPRRVSQVAKGFPSACTAVVSDSLSMDPLLDCGPATVTATVAVSCPTELPLHVVFVIGRHLAMEDHLSEVKSEIEQSLKGQE